MAKKMPKYACGGKMRKYKTGGKLPKYQTKGELPNNPVSTPQSSGVANQTPGFSNQTSNTVGYISSGVNAIAPLLNDNSYNQMYDNYNGSATASVASSIPGYGSTIGAAAQTLETVGDLFNDYNQYGINENYTAGYIDSAMQGILDPMSVLEQQLTDDDKESFSDYLMGPIAFNVESYKEDQKNREDALKQAKIEAQRAVKEAELFGQALNARDRENFVNNVTNTEFNKILGGDKTSALDMASNQFNPDQFQGNSIFQNGGALTYTGQSHAGPNEGIPVDKNGNPVSVSGSNPIALTEGNEVMWHRGDKDAPYIFSDKLGYSTEAQKVMNKYKRRLGGKLNGNDKLAKEAMNRELTDIMNRQEQENAKKASKRKKAVGGPIENGATTSEVTVTTPNYRPVTPITFEQQLTRKGLNIDTTSNDPTAINAQIADYYNLDPNVDMLPYRAVSGDNGIAYQKNFSRTVGEQYNPQTGEVVKNINIPKYTYASGGKLTKYQEPNRRNNYSGVLSYIPESEVMNYSDPNAYYNYNNPTTVYDNLQRFGQNVSTNIPTYSTMEDAPVVNTTDKYSLLQQNTPYVGIGAAADIATNAILINRANKRANQPGIRPAYVAAPEITYEAARRGLRQQGDLATATARTRARQAGTGASQYLSNALASDVAINRNLGDTISRSIEQEANINAQNRFQADSINAQSRMRADEINARNRLINQAAADQYIQNIGQTVQGATRDIGDLSRDNRYLDLMQSRTMYTIAPDGKTLIPVSINS